VNVGLYSVSQNRTAVAESPRMRLENPSKTEGAERRSNMKTSTKSGWLLAALGLTVAACGEEPTRPEVADLDPVAAFGKPGGGGKPAPSADIPLTVEFADGADRVRSDGDRFYVHKLEFVSAIIRTDGMLYFQTFDGKKKDPVLRGVTVDLSVPATVFSPNDLTDFQADVAAAGDEWPVFTSDVTLHTRSLNGGMIGMGATLLDAGKIGFNDYGGQSWEWRLLFGARIETPEGGVDHYEYGLCVTRDGEGWIVTNQGNCESHTLDAVTELWRVLDGVFTHVADFTTPMHLTLSRN
jgi:hypothetical protein